MTTKKWDLLMIISTKKKNKKKKQSYKKPDKKEPPKKPRKIDANEFNELINNKGKENKRVNYLKSILVFKDLLKC